MRAPNLDVFNPDLYGAVLRNYDRYLAGYARHRKAYSGLVRRGNYPIGGFRWNVCKLRYYSKIVYAYCDITSGETAEFTSGRAESLWIRIAHMRKALGKSPHVPHSPCMAAAKGRRFGGCLPFGSM